MKITDETHWRDHEKVRGSEKFRIKGFDIESVFVIRPALNGERTGLLFEISRCSRQRVFQTGYLYCSIQNQYQIRLCISIVKVHSQSNSCVNRDRIRSYSGPHFPRIFKHTLYLSVFSPNAGNLGKIGTRITPNTDTFYSVIALCILRWTTEWVESDNRNCVRHLNIKMSKALTNKKYIPKVRFNIRTAQYTIV